MCDMGRCHAADGGKSVSVVDGSDAAAAVTRHRRAGPSAKQVVFLLAEGFDMDEENGRRHRAHAHVRESEHVFHFHAAQHDGEIQEEKDKLAHDGIQHEWQCLPQCIAVWMH